MHVQETQFAAHRRIMVGPLNDTAVNLAAEELIFDEIQPGDVHLCLYVDRPSVVLGKHQNPWRECSLTWLRESSIPVYRRISGGGTVYHDPGNLNFSFLLDRELFDKMGNLRLVARALERFGIDGVVTERGDILVGGRKVSGNALAIKKGRVMHHGTLLVKADLSLLRRALRRQPVAGDGTSADAAPWASEIETHAVRSEPAPVANLCDFAEGLTVEQVSEAIREEFAAEWGASFVGSLTDAVDPDARSALEERNRSWSWNFGNTPKFDALFPLLQDGSRLRLHVLDATISGAECSDCATAAAVLAASHESAVTANRCTVGATLTGTPFESTAILARCSDWFRSSPGGSDGESRAGACNAGAMKVLSSLAELREF